MKKIQLMNKKINKEGLNKFIKIIKILLFITMMILIYLVSPRITQVIQNTAKYIAELDNNLITRIVELILTTLSVSLVITKLVKEK